MYLAQLKNVNQLAEMLEKIEAALQQVKIMREEYETREDAGGLPEHDMVYGWGVHLAMHRDGSGCRVPMEGLYLGVEMLDATEKLLLDRKELIEVILHDEYGLEG